MAALRSLIRQQRIVNEDGRRFIPNGTLDSCITSRAIHECLKECEIDPWRLEELTATVIQGSKKVFAILVLIKQERELIRFVEDDGFRDQSLDSRIPFALEDLERVLNEAAGEFYEEQWRFAAPKFTRQLTHRFFQDDVILPFTSSRLLGRGGFGQVYDVTITSNHHDFHSDCTLPSEIRVARKELEIDEEFLNQNPKAAWLAGGAREQRVLSALQHLKNPNILELLASYTYRRRHYLLFPLAEGGDLRAFLDSEERLPEFRENATIWTALAGLGSALESMHIYSSSTLQLEMIGFHHDINPKNILISGDSFILSDFGLSKLEVRDDSKTTFKVGRGFYLAPECEKLQSHFEKGIITRASDIWSFGCVLLEVIIYMHFGRDGVRAFSDDRRIQIGNYITRTFFAEDEVNPAVHIWMSSVCHEADVISKKAIALANRMLCLDPDRRAKANQVKAQLRLLCIEAHFAHSKSTLHELLAVQKTFDIFLELKRLEAWGSTWDLGFYADEVPDGQSIGNLQGDLTFTSALSLLRELREFGLSSSQSSAQRGSISSRMRAINDDLFGLLDPTQQQRATRCLEITLISREADSDYSLAYEWPPYLDVGYREATKLLHALSLETSLGLKKDLLIPRDALRDWEVFQACIKAKLFREGEPSSIFVMIEWIVYDVKWTAEIGRKLFKRIGTLVEVLGSVSKTSLFPVLSCRGYFHAPDRKAFGIVYDLPAPCGSSTLESSELISLHGLIQTITDVKQRPMLDDIFGFAKDLAQGLLDFHKVRWLHKSLNSFNIILIRENASDPLRDLLGKFRVVGFNHSRPNHPSEYSEGAWERSDVSRMYQDPDYLQSGWGYSVEHDHFSFGLILLELGLWKCLDTMLPKTSHGLKTESVEHLLKKWVPALGPRMGKRYREVVTRCLNKSLKVAYQTSVGPQDTTDAHDVTIRAFDKYVVQELEAYVL